MGQGLVHRLHRPQLRRAVARLLEFGAITVPSVILSIVIASEVPAKYVYDTMFLAQNLGQGFAASTMMLVTVMIVVVPWAYLEFGGKRRHV